MVIRSGAVRLTAMVEAKPSCFMLASFVTGDAGVVHDDVDTAELLLDVLGDALQGVLAGDVEGEVVAAELGVHRLKLARGLGHVDAEDRRSVAVQHPGDLLADAAAGSGDEGDLAGQRLGPVLDLAASVGPWAPIRMTWPDT